jgi:FG-GAP-like repeat
MARLSSSSANVPVSGLAILSAFALACGSTGQSTFSDGGSSDGKTHGDGTVPDASRHDAGKLSSGHDAAMETGKGACTEGALCGDGGVCAGGSCCPSKLACGSSCCASDLVCSFNACVKPGAACFDSTGCDGGQYCQYTVGASGDAGSGDAAGGDGACVGGALPQGVCLPAPPTCPSDAGAPDGAACIESCQYHPEAGAFAPALLYSWGGQVTAPTATDVMMAPIVLPMEDTNCDGKVNSEDIPDIVFTTFSGGDYESNGTLHAIAVRSGALVDRWSVASPVMVDGSPFMIDPAVSIAGGVLDVGTQGAEVVVCLTQKTDAGTVSGVAAFHPDGTLYWAVKGPVCAMPSIADLNQDGKPEVIVEGGILDGETGALTSFTNGSGVTVSDIGYFVVSDINGDGILDVVTAGAAYSASGARFVDTGLAGGFVAIGDLDNDGTPDVIGTGAATISIWHYLSSPPAPQNFGWMQRNLDINALSASAVCAASGGGPPTVADFNGDGVPDVALAGSVNYTIFDGRKLTSVDAGPGGTDGGNAEEFFLWAYYPTDDCSSRETGSTIFDFTGNGRPEALYSDQQKLRIFNGPDGGVLFQTCNTTGTLVEYPIVVDVDNDGHAEMVVVSNAYGAASPTIECANYDGGPTGQSGIRVYGDPNLKWVRTRAIWNEHAYHITNVNDDGTIPQVELPNWTQPGLNNFRQNKAPGYEFAAPNAVVSVAAPCGQMASATAPVTTTLTATVRNIGEAALPSGVYVYFYGAGGTKLGQAVTTISLYSAQSQSLALPDVPATSGPFYAVVDPPGAPPHPAWHQCRTDNNTSATVPYPTTGCGPTALK